MNRRSHWSPSQTGSNSARSRSRRAIPLRLILQRLVALALFAVLLWLAPTPARAESGSNWRIFSSLDGLKESHTIAVTVSPRGNVWAKHPEADEISVYDGYSIRTLPSPGKDNYRVYESRSGQLWSLYNEGLIVFENDKWVRFPIAEIASEIQADPLRRLRQVPLVPADRDRVFFLLSDRLGEFDAHVKRVRFLKSASDTSLERFVEMAEARDGGLWISGNRGIAKVRGPLRSLNADSLWQEFLLPSALQVENVQRPFEDDQGWLTMSASDLAIERRRVMIRFDGTNWFKHAPPMESIRLAWQGWDRQSWACTFNSLLRFNGDSEHPGWTKTGAWLGIFKDVALETNGVFWLGTSEGLVRHGPHPWRTPSELESLDSLVHAILEDSSGRIWCASVEGLAVREGNKWRYYSWPQGFEANFSALDFLTQLPDGRIAVSHPDAPLLFSPESERFEALTHPEGWAVRLLGTLPDKTASVQTSVVDPSGNHSYRVEHFDGRDFKPLFPNPVAWLQTNEISFFQETQRGDYWMGGPSGIAVLRENQLQTFGPADGFTADRAFCFLQLYDGRIWCGVYNRIFEYNGTTWTLVRSGLDRVNAMIQGRGGKIWIATNRGLYCVSNNIWILNNLEEGLPTSAILDVWEDRRGQLWAGSSRGISLYYPEADTSPPKTLAPVVVGQDKNSTESPVSIAFNAVDKWQQTPPQHLLYSFRLNDGPWTPWTNAAMHSFDKLSSGQHRLEVRAMDSHWNMDPAVAALEWFVIVPWYKEPRLLSVSILGATLVLFFAGVAVNRHRRLVHSYAEVERMVSIRTKELERANEELLHSQKMRALGTLTAGIAHDFNNILSIIKGSAQIIESNLTDKEKIRTRVNRIKTVVEQGSGIVRSMLGLTRVSERDLAMWDLNEIADDTVKLLGDRFLNEITLHFEPAPSLPPVLTIKEIVQQMLFNLITNAADAMAGEGEILLQTRMLHTPSGVLALAPSEAPAYLAISVTDAGTGIAPEVMPRIFEPFFTTKAFSTRRGTGLGLSMVYELAKELGYGLKVETELRRGSTFTILIPLRK